MTDKNRKPVNTIMRLLIKDQSNVMETQHLILSEVNMSLCLEQAVSVLKQGGIIAYPTETFYGLGVRFDSEVTLRRLFDIKQRPNQKALPLIIGDTRQLSVITSTVNDIEMAIIRQFWPGPLTLLLPGKKGLPAFITAGTGNVAVRIPGESFALHLCRTAGFPVTATSANPSGLPPAQDARTADRYFAGQIDLIIDGGTAPGGLPSTIIRVAGKEIIILREGAVNSELLSKFSDRFRHMLT
jgi:L-threonylcarbamoyladenylate synthase